MVNLRIPALLALLLLAACEDDGLNEPVPVDLQPALMALATDAYLEALTTALPQEGRAIVTRGVNDLQLALTGGTRGQVERALGTVETGLAQAGSAPEVVASLRLVSEHIRAALAA